MTTKTNTAKLLKLKTQGSIDKFLGANPTFAFVVPCDIYRNGLYTDVFAYDLSLLGADTDLTKLPKLAVADSWVVEDWHRDRYGRFMKARTIREERVIKRKGKRTLHAYTLTTNSSWKFNNPLVNDGLPEGVKFEHLQIGAVVTIMWEGEEDTMGLIIDEPSDKRGSDIYIRVMHYTAPKRGEKRVYGTQSIVQTQIKSVTRNAIDLEEFYEG